MAIAIVYWMQYQWQYQYQLFVEYNTNCNTNTNCFWNAISMAIPIPIVCVIQYQWQYQYQFFFLCNFNINCNSNTFNCLRTNSNVQAINSYWNLPISIAIPIVPDLHKQLSMAMAIPSKTAIPMAPQYYCSCLSPTWYCWPLASRSSWSYDPHLCRSFLQSLNAHIFQSGLRWSEFEVPNYLADLKATLPSFWRVRSG